METNKQTNMATGYGVPLNPQGAGWKNSMWYCGVVPVIHRERLENLSLSLTWLKGTDYCPLIGHNPGLLLACLLDITL
jgi:hypothetical protein